MKVATAGRIRAHASSILDLSESLTGLVAQFVGLCPDESELVVI
jgi:hypothetical protein